LVDPAERPKKSKSESAGHCLHTNAPSAPKQRKKEVAAQKRRKIAREIEVYESVGI
jgi:hypothetical protein